jgi:hypothetical protein
MTPPPSLGAGFQLDIETVTRTTLHRIYWPSQDPLAPSVAGDNRYDCAGGLAPADRFGVLYLAFDLETCWMETVVRANVVRPAGSDIPVPMSKLRGRWACEVSAAAPLVLARFADTPLIDLGECASNIMADSYLRTQRWAQLLHAHSLPQVDGIWYRSRFKTDCFCVALFDRAISTRGLSLNHQRSIDPPTSAEAQSIMRRYKVVPV